MKKSITKLFCLTLLAAPLLTGCKSVTPVNQATVDSVAVILRGAARDGTIAAITPPGGNANNAAYFKLAAEATGTFITGKDYSPAAFQSALTGIKVDQLNDPWVKIAVGTLVDLYQLYYGLYVQPNLKSNAPVALEFVQAIQDGFNQGLGDPVSSARARAAHSPVATLPRPIVPFRARR